MSHVFSHSSYWSKTCPIAPPYFYGSLYVILLPTPALYTYIFHTCPILSTMFAIDVLHFVRDVLCLPVGVACFSICSYDFLRESRVSVYVSTFPLYFLSAPLYISEARPSCFTFCYVFPIYFLCIFHVTVYTSILSYISHTFLYIHLFS